MEIERSNRQATEAERLEEELTLVELVNRVLDRGVVITGDVVLSIASVDLVYLGLNLVLTSVEGARRTSRPLPRRARGE